MAGLDVFKADAFSMEGMLSAVENIDYKPQYLGSLNLFEPNPQPTRAVMVESRDNELSLIQTSPIGAPLAQRGDDKATVRTFNTVRLAKGSRIMADAIQGIRQFGSQTELKQVQEVVARRLQRLRDDMELTHEFHRLGAVQGKLLDANNAEIYDFFDEFDVNEPNDVDFAFGTLDPGELRPVIEGVVRAIVRAAKGSFTTGSKVIGLCGDDFWDALVNHDEVRQTYLNQLAAASLREPTAFGTFDYAGVRFVNYRGTDDGSTVAIGADACRFFPQGANGVFEVAWAPAEFMDAVNMPGREITSLIVPDPTVRNAYVDVEVYSYPLFICKKPLTLRKGVIGT